MFEVNVQRTKNSKWQSGTFGTQKQAEDAADLWRRVGAFNVNWRGTRATDPAVVWVVREGKVVK